MTQWALHLFVFSSRICSGKSYRFLVFMFSCSQKGPRRQGPEHRPVGLPTPGGDHLFRGMPFPFHVPATPRDRYQRGDSIVEKADQRRIVLQVEVILLFWKNGNGIDRISAFLLGKTDPAFIDIFVDTRILRYGDVIRLSHGCDHIIHFTSNPCSVTAVSRGMIVERLRRCQTIRGPLMKAGASPVREPDGYAFC